MDRVTDLTAIAAKSTQDILDRLAWLDGRRARSRARIEHWQRIDDRRGEEIAACRVILRERGIVDIVPVVDPDAIGFVLDGEDEPNFDDDGGQAEAAERNILDTGRAYPMPEEM